MDNLITCTRCGSDACYVQEVNETVKLHFCYGCGFQANSVMTRDSEFLQQQMETLPELYKALKFKDEKGFHWYPIALTFDDKSMIFAEGVSTESWKWSAVKAKDGKPDMTSKQEFEERDFLEALDYVGYFNQK